MLCSGGSSPEWGEGPPPLWLREPSHWLAPPGPPKWLLPKLFWRKAPGADAMECAGVAGGVAAGVPKGVPAHSPVLSRHGTHPPSAADARRLHTSMRPMGHWVSTTRVHAHESIPYMSATSVRSTTHCHALSSARALCKLQCSRSAHRLKQCGLREPSHSGGRAPAGVVPAENVGLKSLALGLNWKDLAFGFRLDFDVGGRGGCPLLWPGCPPGHTCQTK